MDINEITNILLSKSINPHYTKRYVSFVFWCMQINDHQPPEITEKHHILPAGKTFWPEYKSLKQHKWNKATLSPRQHYIAHMILAKALGGGMWYAFYVMATYNNPTQHRTTSIMYEKLKHHIRHYLSRPKSEEWKRNISRPKTDEWKRKIGDSNRFPKLHLYPDDFSEKMSNLMKDLHTGVPKSEEHRRKIGDSHRGTKRSEEARNNIRAAHYTNDTNKRRDVVTRMSETRSQNNPVFKEPDHVKQLLVDKVYEQPDISPHLLSKYYSSISGAKFSGPMFRSVIRAIKEDRFLSTYG